jgi:hypothetical protein
MRWANAATPPMSMARITFPVHCKTIESSFPPVVEADRSP